MAGGHSSSSSGMKTQHTEKLAEFVSGLKYEDLPAPVIERLKWSVLDTLGCGIYGSATPWGRIVSSYASRVQGPCNLWGIGGSSDAANAALANGTMIHSFEVDDIHTGGRLHPGGVTIPVALALAAELGQLSGKDLFAALAGGFEAVIRTGICQGKSAFDRGWHPTGTAGIFGSAATAARLLGLSTAATCHCLGVAGTMPAGLMAAQYGAMVKRLFVGHAAMVGLMAARLAADGFTGIPDIFDVEYGGYPKAVSDAPDMEALSRDLGTHYETLGVGYKFYSCVGTNFTALDALKEILKEHPVAAGDIEAIVVRTSEYQKLHSGWDYKPSTVMAAQMNMQYCIAALVVEGEVFVDQFVEEKIARPDLLALVSRVRVEVDAEINALPPHYRTSDVELVTRDGKSFRARRDFFRGHARNLPSWQDIEDKFRLLAGRVLPASQVNEIVDFVAHLEDSANVADLAKLLVP
jgi:aconitate decarboxylase